MKKSNRLALEKSPYLRQHQWNPVDWFPWGVEAFERAKSENKLILLSIGYATCHWCHVMERETFEVQEVADAINLNYISVKVDREEHPDVDQIYMSAAHVMGQRGGWPLNLVLTPDLKPIFSGTYFPREKFVMTLNQIAELWRKDSQKILETGNHVTEFLIQRASGVEIESKDSLFKEFPDQTPEMLREFLKYSRQSFDPEYGGFGNSPKFPPYLQIDVLLDVYRRSKDAAILEMIEVTLDRMAAGGIFDQIGGGFARYSVDGEWAVPHFEKMLYTQALLTMNYLGGFQLTQRPLYAEIARETLGYVLRDMEAPEGGYFSAEDADSEGIEGQFYVWTPQDLWSCDLNSTEMKTAANFWGISERGNFEHGKTILTCSINFLHARSANDLKSASAKMLKFRSTRPRPLRDEKILTSWNALMIRAFCSGFRVLGESSYLVSAQRAANFIREHLWISGRLMRRYCEGETKYPGTLDDYAFLIQALLTLYQTDFDVKWFEWALELQSQQDLLFCDVKGGYFLTSEDTPYLLVRSKEVTDDALPSGNAVSVRNLLDLHDLTQEETFLRHAQKILAQVQSEMMSYPQAFPTALRAGDRMNSRSAQVVIPVKSSMMSQAEQILRKFWEEYYPNAVIVAGDPANIRSPKILRDQKVTDPIQIHICEQFLCHSPTENLSEALEIFRELSRERGEG